MQKNDEVDKALDYLDALSRLQVSVDARTHGATLRGTPTFEVTAYSLHKDVVTLLQRGDGHKYQHQITASLSSGKIASVEYTPSHATVHAGAVRQAYYAVSGKGLRVNPSDFSARLFDQFQGFGTTIQAQDLVGYYGFTPLSALVRHAQREGHLTSVMHDDGGVTITCPFDLQFGRTGDQTAARQCLELSFEPALGGTRLIRQRILLADGSLFRDLSVADWQQWEGHFVPRRAQLRVPVSGLSQPIATDPPQVEFALEIVYSGEALVTGSEILDMVVSVGSLVAGQSTYVSIAGVERALVDGREFFDGEDSEPSRGTQHDELQSAISGLRSSASRSWLVASWPSMDSSAIENFVDTHMAGFDSSTGYCSQAAAALLLRLNGGEWRFSDFVKEAPAKRLPLSSTIELLASHGLEMVAIESENIAALAQSNQAFLVLEGESKEQGHLSVARRNAGGGYRRWKLPPSSSKIGSDALMQKQSPLGIFVVPRSWVANGKNSNATTSTFFLGLGALLGAALLALLFHKSVRARGITRSSSPALLLLSVVICAGCSQEALVESTDAHNASASQLIALTCEQPHRSVVSGGSVDYPVIAENTSSTKVEIVAVSGSCHCIRFPGALPVTLEPGAKHPLTIQGFGAKPGLINESLQVVGESGGRQALTAIRLSLDVGTPLHLDPPAPTVSGVAGSRTGDVFNVIYRHPTAPDNLYLEFEATPNIDIEYHAQLLPLPESGAHQSTTWRVECVLPSALVSAWVPLRFNVRSPSADEPLDQLTCDIYLQTF